jgi:hypothetical protein
MENFAIMNNTPTHFLVAGLTVVTFLAAVFTNNQATKDKLRTALMWLFAIVLLTGLYIWTVVPITAAVIVKSLGGLLLMWTMLQLVKQPRNSAYWILFVAVAAVGLSLAFFFI